MMHPGGELAAAAAAGEAGTIYTLSTVSGHKLEDVRAASKGPVWYQLYLVGGREVAEAALERALKSGFHALAVTVDTAVAGNRERDIRNGMKQLLGGSLVSKLPYVSQFLEKPAWLAGYFLDGGRPKLENIVIPGKGPLPLVGVGDALARAVVTWEDFRWIREMWKGPIVTKGVLTGDDARRAVDEGSVAVVVSNHGARQLDTVSSTLRALPEVVRAIGGRTEVLMDGGFRYRQGVVPWREGGARRPRLRLRHGSRRQAGCCPRTRDFAGRVRAHAQAFRLPVGRMPERVLHFGTALLELTESLGRDLRKTTAASAGQADRG